MLQAARQRLLSVTGKVGPSSKDELEVLSWEEEPNLSLRNVHRLLSELLKDRADMASETKLLIIKELGHTAYMGGTQASISALRGIPYLMNILSTRNTDVPIAMHIQVLKSLSEMVHRNTKAQMKLLMRPSVLEILVELLNSPGKHPSTPSCVVLCRWTCYLLLILISDNSKGMKILKADDEMRKALLSVAKLDLEWHLWGYDLSDLLLKVLGHSRLVM